MSTAQPYIQRTGGRLWRWRVAYPNAGRLGMETLHATKLGARFALLMYRA